MFSRRRRVYRVLLAGILFSFWTTVLLLGLELYLRWDRARIAGQNRLLEENRALHGAMMEARAESLWEVERKRYRRNARLAFTMDGVEHVVQTNEHGFRTHPVQLPKPPDRFRIVCVGGSTTVEGTTNETTYPALVEQRLRKRFPHRDLEVLNCGVSGLDATVELERLEDYLALEPDLLVEYNVINDLCWHLLPELEHARPRFERWLRRSELLAATSLRPGFDQRALDTLLIRRVLSRLARTEQACRARGVRAVFASFAAPNPKDPREAVWFEDHMQRVWHRMPRVTLAEYRWAVGRYNTGLKQWCTGSRIGYLPVAENFPDGGIDTFIDICHMTQAGIDRKAELVAKLLEGFVDDQY
ncbi:MAG: hypothetical protein HY319_28585 [Armatimonadetes bacterium]|nr:hypothetical protein [Armatimonadota bacterium]